MSIESMGPDTIKENELREAALEYHRSPTRGRIEVVATKALSNQRELSSRIHHFHRRAAQRPEKPDEWRKGGHRLPTLPLLPEDFISARRGFEKRRF